MDSVNISFPCSLLKTASSRIGSLALQSLFALVSFCGSDWFGSTCFNRIDYDGMAYTDVARQVSRGEFHSSINAFRSPLFSWIIALALCSFGRDAACRIFARLYGRGRARSLKLTSPLSLSFWLISSLTN